MVGLPPRELQESRTPRCNCSVPLGGAKGVLGHVRIIFERQPRWFLHSSSVLVILAYNHSANEFPTKT